MRLRHRQPAGLDPATAVVTHLVTDQIRRTRLRDYAEGVVDGMIEVLERLTGEKPDGPPEISSDVRLWAEDALRRARAERAA